MMLNENLKTHIAGCLSEQFSANVNIINAQHINGGSINEAYCLQTDSGNYFIKLNDADKFPDMFQKEVMGLKILAATKTIHTPEVILNDQYEGTSFLLLQFVEAGKRLKNFYSDFGIKLAALHRNTNIYFGLNHNNYIGSLNQSNIQQKNGMMFFVHERLQVQVALALRKKAIDSSTVNQFEKLYQQLPNIIPIEKPALLHGDLWHGNLITAPDGSACLIDPAVYYGNREADIAMSKLFGGFDQEFYESYHASFPLTKGWEQRMDIWNLYPLLVHINLFGAGYLNQVKIILNRFV